MRSPTVDHHFPEVPQTHIQTNGRDMGMNLAQVIEDMTVFGIIKQGKGKRRSKK